jgi:hypothetical protein
VIGTTAKPPADVVGEVSSVEVIGVGFSVAGKAVAGVTSAAGCETAGAAAAELVARTVGLGSSVEDEGEGEGGDAGLFAMVANPGAIEVTSVKILAAGIGSDTGDAASVAVVAAFPFVLGLSVVYPPIGPVNVGLAVTKTMVMLGVPCCCSGAASVTAALEAASLDGRVTSAVVTEVSNMVVWACTVVVEVG